MPIAQHEARQPSLRMIDCSQGRSTMAPTPAPAKAIGIPGQIILGDLSDRIGRECVWTAGCTGFPVCYATLIAREHAPTIALLYVMVFAKGFFDYTLTSVMGPSPRFSRVPTTARYSAQLLWH
jgi:hypothetical protein